MFLSPYWIKHHVVAMLLAAATCGFVFVHPQAVQAVDLLVSAPAPGATQTFSSGTQTYEGLIVGNNAGEIGTLNITSGVTFNTGAVGHSVVVGNLLGSTGTVNLSGAGTTWTDNYYATTIGQNGAGALNVESGAKVNIYALNVGYDTGATGSVSLTGAGSYLKTQSGVTFGYGGNPASLSITNGAGLETVLGSLYMKHGASLTLDGVGSSLRVGTLHSGTPTDWTTADGWFSPEKATINVTGGAYLETDGCYLIGGSDGAAVMTLTGAGTQMDAHLLIYVGGDGNGQPYEGRLTISAAATANASSVAVGLDTGSTGTLLVTGTGSSLSTQSNNAGFYGNVYAGSFGNGHITIEQGASLSASGQLRVGYFSDTVGGTLVGSVGVLDITSGATVSSGILSASYGPAYGNAYGTIIGGDVATTGTVNVSGAGTTWTDQGLDGILVGKSGSGTLNIADGAQVTATRIVLALSSGSTGTLNIGAAQGSAAVAAGTVTSANGIVFGSGTGTVVFNHTDTNYTFSPAISGNGTVKVLSGTTVLTGANTYSGDTIISGGTLKAGGTNVLSANSAVTVNASGTLDLAGYDQDIAGLSGVGAVTLGSGTLTVNNSGNYTFGGTISGTGGLTKAGSGVLTLSGSNAYSGATTVNAGTLQAGAANAFSPNSVVTVNSNGILNLNNYAQTIAGLSGSGSVALGSAALTVNTAAGSAYTFYGVIADSGSGGSLVKSGAGTLTLSGANTYTGGTTIQGGILAVSGDSNLGASTGTLAFNGGTLQLFGALTTGRPILVASSGGTLNNNGNAVNLSGTLGGSGDLMLSGSGLTTLGSSFNGSSYGGTATLSAGTLQLTAGSSLGGTLALSAGTTLQGTGTVGSLTNGGTVSPGVDSLATITVGGNYVQTAGGTLQCDLTPSGYDSLAVSGSATLGGTLDLRPQYTYYASGTTWQILSASGGSTGTFSTVQYTDTPEHWVFVPVYTSDGVYVSLQRESFSLSALSNSAAAVGWGLDAAAYSATGPMAALITALDYSSGEVTNYSLNVLNAQVYDAFTQPVFEAGRALTVIQRTGLLGGAGGVDQAFANGLDMGPQSLAVLTGMHAAEKDKTLPLGDTNLSLGRLSVFIKTVGLHSSQEAKSGQTGYDSLAGGVTGGLVYRTTEHFSVGLAPGFVSQSVKLYNVGGGTGGVQDWSLALLGSYVRDVWHVEGSIRAGYDVYKSSRNLPLPTGTYTAKGQWNGWNVNVALAGGYDFKFDEYVVGPVASVEWQRMYEAPFTETGAGTMGQSVRRRDGASLNTALGLRFARTFETKRGEVTPEIRAAWGAQWLGQSQGVQAAFIGNPTSTYTAKSADQRYNSLLLDAGVSVRLSDSMSGNIRGGVELFRPGYSSQAVSVGLKYTF